MPKLPHITGQILVRAMEWDGFEVTRIKGSHFILQKTFADGECVTIPVLFMRDRLSKRAHFLAF
jgi:predicted RNA binding protein YcfA (HicA-like mRNA interferase family)